MGREGEFGRRAACPPRGWPARRARNAVALVDHAGLAQRLADLGRGAVRHHDRLGRRQRPRRAGSATAHSPRHRPRRAPAPAPRQRRRWRAVRRLIAGFRAALRKRMEALVPPKPKLLDSATSIVPLLRRVRHPVDRRSRGSGCPGSASAARRCRAPPGSRRSPRPRRPRPADGRSPTWWTTSPALGGIAEQALHRLQLEVVAERRRGAVGVDVLDVWSGADAAVAQRRLHGAEGAVVALGRRGDVVGVAGHAVAAHLGVDLGAALPGVLVLLQHHARRRPRP